MSATHTCMVCGALLPPGAERCPRCDAEVGDVATARDTAHVDSAAQRNTATTPAVGLDAPAGAAAHGVGWYRAAVFVLGILFLASALAVLHMELTLR